MYVITIPLEGSVKKSSDRLRITAQLIDATNGHHLWAKQYQQPDNLMARIMITAIYSMAGYDEKEQAEAHEMLQINPKFSLDRLAKRASPRLTEALRKSGLK